MKTIVTSFLFCTLATMPIFADWKLSQKTNVGSEGVAQITTMYQKGVRKRTETKTVFDDPEMAAMMAQMGSGMMFQMPTSISQCDLKQDVLLNERGKSYFIDYYDWSTLPPEKLTRLPKQKMVIKGTLSIDAVLTDSGKRQQMFGLTARWLKWVQTVETSADSCDGASSVRMEQEGWFVTLSLESENCPIRRPPTQETGGCRPKIVIKRAQNAGVMLTGKTTMFVGGKQSMTTEIETLDLSKTTLDQALFEIPTSWAEVDSLTELINMRGSVDTSAKTIFGSETDKPKSVKTIAIDFFSGNTSKVDQDELRGYISSKITAAGMSGFPVNSQADLANGNFVNVISVELKKVKESGASKVGGLFGKVTGSSDAAKLGSSQAEIVVTIYGKDGKTVIASSPANADVKGKGDDAVKAAIDQVISGLLAKIK